MSKKNLNKSPRLNHGIFARYLLLIVLLLWSGGCAYYNTLFNAKKTYNQGLKAIREGSGQAGTPQAARKHFEATIDKCWKLIELYSDKSKYADDALLYIAKSEYHLQKYSQAKLHLEQFIKKYPESNLLSEAHLWYGKVLLEEDEVEKANEYFLLVINNAKDAKIRSEANLSLGLYAFEKENYGQSIGYFEKALKEKLDDEYKALLLYHLGEAYYIQKNYKEAIDQYKKVEKFDPSTDVEYHSTVHLAKSYAALKKYKEAERILKKLLTAPRLQAYVPGIKTALGEIYEEQERMEDAVEIYTEVVQERKSHPGTAQAAYDLARIYETYYHDIDSAVAYYGKVGQLYSKFDSVQAANQKKAFLSEFKEIRDKIRRDEQLTYRLKNDPAFMDSLYQAQYQDSLNKASGIPNQPQVTSTESDSLLRLRAHQDSIAWGLIDTTALALADSLQQQDPDSLAQQTEEDLFKGFREQETEEQVSSPQQPALKSEQQNSEQPQKPLEKRKLPQIEFDLMNNRYQLAEYYLLKVQNYDSAAYHYKEFLETYEDSILTPKALYSLSYIYKLPGHKDPQQAQALEQKILNNYPNSVFALEIRKNKGLVKEEKTALSPEEEAEQLFLKAESLYFAGNYYQSIDAYRYIASLDTNWLISAKAQFATAWIYEHDLVMKDSALAAYHKIIDHYPAASQYVKVARNKTTPIKDTPRPAETDSTLAAAAQAPQDSVVAGPGTKTAAVAAGFKLGSEDILQDKIRWRIRRDGATRNPRDIR